jgi:serine/threonine-protein kinase
MLIRRPGRRELVRKLEGDGATQYVVEKEGEYDFVKILDFGIAKVLTPDEHGPKQTLAGAVFGTPEYMAPEAARGEEVDHRADVYSTAVILFDMITGRPPFEAQAAAEVLAMQINEPPPPARTIAPGLEITESVERLILKCMSKNPDDRIQTMDAFRDELQDCYGSVAFRRNHRSTHLPPTGMFARKRRLTEELDEWLHGSGQGLSLEEARALALAEAARDRIFDDGSGGSTDELEDD